MSLFTTTELIESNDSINSNNKDYDKNEINKQVSSIKDKDYDNLLPTCNNEQNSHGLSRPLLKRTEYVNPGFTNEEQDSHGLSRPLLKRTKYTTIGLMNEEQINKDPINISLTNTESVNSEFTNEEQVNKDLNFPSLMYNKYMTSGYKNEKKINNET